jgi:hypothetical protein
MGRLDLLALRLQGRQIRSGNPIVIDACRVPKHAATFICLVRCLSARRSSRSALLDWGDQLASSDGVGMRISWKRRSIIA